MNNSVFPFMGVPNTYIKIQTTPRIKNVMLHTNLQRYSTYLKFGNARDNLIQKGDFRRDHKQFQSEINDFFLDVSMRVIY